MNRHEDILIFLEDNISKLVKLKVASRAKYKEYDERYMDYLTAESIDDEERMESYGEMVEACRFTMVVKLKKAIDVNPQLTIESVVAKYMKLMK